MKKYGYEYFASCPMGLEELLFQEIKGLGATTAQLVRGGVQFEAFHEIALKVILHTRLASRVYKYLYSFEAHNEKDYYLGATEIKWKTLMEVEQTFRLTTVFGDLPQEREDFRNSQFANLKLKDAIVDYFRHFEGERPSVEKDHPDVAFLARVERGEEKPFKITLMLDLCGDPLNQRGYRISLTEAPLKENLAAALLMLAKWDPGTEGLLDATCGSGTIAIEAALIAGNIPPSFIRVERYLKNPNLRPWTFLNYPWLTKDAELMANFKLLMQEVTEATEKGIKKLAARKGEIVANDISDRAIFAARENLKEARLDGVIQLQQKDALETNPPTAKCLFICNPPYGERLEHGEEEKLKALYKGLGDRWKQNFKGHRAVLFTGNLSMLKVVGLKSAKRHILFNGDIECRLAEYSLY
ncbi:MAG TPA: THUMP domain-containing protein [Bacteriovoracaceae bacterium]|nr:THUMP domain-containing protein [Bacteriovoracaceae bacterium]